MRRTSPNGAKLGLAPLPRHSEAKRGIPRLSVTCEEIPRRSFLPPRDDMRKTDEMT